MSPHKSPDEPPPEQVTAAAVKLLTIGVPTYNRASILDKFLEQIRLDVGQYSSKVKIIVSDNCSTDGTESTCRRWMSVYGDELEIRYTRNESNIGVSKNLVSLFYKADTQYFMFLGDDDRLKGDFFPDLMEILASEQRPTAVIQCVWRGRQLSRSSGYVPYGEASTLFYEFGNAWASVVDRPAAVRALESRNLRRVVEQIVWPQTVIGFLAIHDQRDRPVYLAPKEIGCQLVPHLNIHNKTYWLRSLRDLLMAATIIDGKLGGAVFRKGFVSPWSRGFTGHVHSIAHSQLVEDDTVSSREVVDLLKAHYGFRGRLCTVLFMLIDTPLLLKPCYLLTRALMTKSSPCAVSRDLKARKKQREHAIAQTATTNRRYGDWF